MNNPIGNEQEIQSALEDSGMEPETINQLLESLRLGQKEKVKRILASHRSKLLSDVHAKQDKLYCMDFISRKLKSDYL